MTVPRPDPPVVISVSHYSVSLRWAVEQDKEQQPKIRYCYTLQQEDCSKHPRSGYVTVYRGYSTHFTVSALKPLTQYNFQLRASTDVACSSWSNIISVTTSKPPYSCESLHKAVRRGESLQVAAILEDNPEFVDVPNILGLSPLMSAAGAGEASVVEVLLHKGANVNYTNSSGRNCVMEACYHGEVGCLELILVAGGSLLSRDGSGFSALHYAVDGGNLDMVSFVLEEGVPADDESTVSGWTPLMRLASLGGDAKLVRLLVENGADVNKKDSDGNSVLMMASLNGFEEIVKMLLECGADPTVKTQHGKTALDFAQSFHREEVAELLQENTTD